MALPSSFSAISNQLSQDLHSLSSESKRRNSEVKRASDKSLQIIRIVHSFEELERHPDFVIPFVLSCKSGNPKFTTLAMQCLQRLAIHKSIPKERIEQVLEALNDSSQLAVEIQLKVLQIIPIFFTTYGKDITGPLCAKLLLCCSNLLVTPSKSPVVVGTASATLKQLISDVFERLKYPGDGSDLYDVAVGNDEKIRVNSYRHDANLLFADLCTIHNTPGRDQSLLDRNCITEEYGLELLETVFLNYELLFLKYEDLLFLLRTKAVPLLLRSVSSSKSFPIVVRSSRCIALLIKVQYLTLLELELEVILSLLIHTLSSKSDAKQWRRILILEIFQSVFAKEGMILEIFKAYDALESRKHVITSLLETLKEMLDHEIFVDILKETPILMSNEHPLVVQESYSSRVMSLDLLDKPNAPAADQTYIVFLLLTISNSISNCIGSRAAAASQDEDRQTLDELADMYQEVYPSLFAIHKKFLYSSNLDNGSFHSLVRAFQKLAHAAGILSFDNELDQCLLVFCVATILNDNGVNSSTDSAGTQAPQTAAVLHAISDTIMRKPSTALSAKDQYKLPSRNFHQRNLSVFRALISLSISLGSTFTETNWNYTLVAWQWTAYYVYGPCSEFLSTHLNIVTPPAPNLTKNDLSTIEGSFLQLFESTKAYPDESFRVFLSCLVDSSIRLFHNNSNGFTDSKMQIDSGGNIRDCYCNSLFYVDRIRDLVMHNLNHFTDTEKGQLPWLQLVEFIVKQVSDRSLSPSLRLYVSRVFMDIVSTIVTNAEELQEPNNINFDSIGKMLLDAMCSLVDTLMDLSVSEEHIFNGVVNVEFEIYFQALRTLKSLLENFGEHLKISWSTVFKLLVSPFGIIEKGVDIIAMETNENATIVEGIRQKYKDLVQLAYEVFKLIPDNFLQNLPLTVMKDFIDTLLKFIRQNNDMNISFSSISQFWPVGDYLRTRTSKSPTAQIISTTTNKDSEVISLSKILSSKTSSELDISNALWVYLLRSLIDCTSDERLEVKKGAIHTFFRIIDSYPSFFPSWKLVSAKVIKKLLSLELTPQEYDEYADFLSITLQGLIQLYSTYFSGFLDYDWTEEWSWLFNFMKRLQSSKSFEARFIVYRSLEELLNSLHKIENLPKNIVESCYEVWSTYNVIYSQLLPSNSKRKDNINCLEQLIRCFGPLYKLLVAFNFVDAKTIEECLAVFNTAFKYPLLPEHTIDTKKPSALQLGVLGAMQQFEFDQEPTIELLIWYQLSSMVVLPFETRKRIERKLSEKLDDVSNVKIPTFEAISYQACILLGQRVTGAKGFSYQFLDEKYLLRTLKHLFEPIKAKSMIGINFENKTPLWVMSSRCFHNIYRLVFPLLSNSSATEHSDLVNELLHLYTRMLVAPLQRNPDVNIPSETEEYDISEYEAQRDLLLEFISLPLITAEHLHPFVSVLWSRSFYYAFDEIDNYVIDSCPNLQKITQSLADFDFESIVGSTKESNLLPNYKIATICLDDLIRFCQTEERSHDLIRTMSIPYLVSRIAFVLRKYISDESLLNRAPLPKVKRLELVKVLHGLNEVISRHKKTIDSEPDQLGLRLLYPLLLKTIPLSHKVEGLQDILQKLSLTFNVLFT
ncbi:HDL422Cp [Eremothecium sinecaudum]|uniref:HDL422Cp n=1 Tax=Eremothecium sinecaudum TaxID=45286 RepID=A0A0X8HRV9_9SACH|nr:HDL422Cp [Eremothecium sinecaudum]AMD20322.1 HDL422Cp [Eremothecium sinecaudum]